MVTSEHVFKTIVQPSNQMSCSHLIHRRTARHTNHNFVSLFYQPLQKTVMGTSGGLDWDLFWTKLQYEAGTLLYLQSLGVFTIKWSSSQ